MPEKKIDGSYNCALCDEPRKQLDVYTLCSGHMDVWYELMKDDNKCYRENGGRDQKFMDFNKKIGANLVR